MSRKNYLIGIAGNIGVGKTTVTDRLAASLGWKAYYESVIDNPYLNDFYADMGRWGFNLQIYFLAHRFRSQKQIVESGMNAIQDRTIYEDVEIFARSLHEQGFIDKRDFGTYLDLFHNMVPYLPAPDIIIYLSASLDTLLERIQQRGRDFEQRVQPDYIAYLNRAYEAWMEQAGNDFHILKINTDDRDFVNGDDDLNDLIEQIRTYCP